MYLIFYICNAIFVATTSSGQQTTNIATDEDDSFNWQDKRWHERGTRSKKLALRINCGATSKNSNFPEQVSDFNVLDDDSIYRDPPSTKTSSVFSNGGDAVSVSSAWMAPSTFGKSRRLGANLGLSKPQSDAPSTSEWAQDFLAKVGRMGVKAAIHHEVQARQDQRVSALTSDLTNGMNPKENHES